MSTRTDLRAVKSPLFAKCMGDVKIVSLGDYLCPECELISQDEYVKGVLDRFARDMSEAHFRLQSDLERIALVSETERA